MVQSALECRAAHAFLNETGRLSMSVKKEQSGPLKAVSTLRPGDPSEKIYDEWSADYDSDLAVEWGYIGPKIAVDALDAYCPKKESAIIDLGCGTGLVGGELRSRGYSLIDGLDVSSGMLEQAGAKGHYRHLTKADLTKRIPLADAAYDVGICVGAMGAGHLGTEHIPELLRIIKPGALLVIYMNAKAYLDEDYEPRLRALEAAGHWRIEKIEASNYMKNLDRPGRLIIGRRPDSNTGFAT